MMSKILLVLLCSLSLLTGGCTSPTTSSTISSTIIESIVTSQLPIILEDPVRLRLVAVGDNLIHYPIYEQAFIPATGSYDFAPSYAPVRELIYGADIAFLNQEVPAAGQEYGISSYPMFNSPQELVRDMAVYLGVDVVNQASNHAIDKGLGGLTTTLELWQEQGVVSLGFWRDPEPDGIRILEKEGLKIAFVAYTYGLNGLDLENWQGWHVGWLDDWAAMQRDVLRAKELADLVIVSLHWGDEGMLRPNAMQEALAQDLATLNVDLVLAHHPHVIQPVTELVRADGRLMPVFYSLGNFISNQIEAENMLGGLATVELVKDADGARVEHPGFLPLVTHFTPRFQQTYVYPLVDYPEDLAAQHGILAYDGRFSKTWLQNLVAGVVSEKYLLDQLP